MPTGLRPEPWGSRKGPCSTSVAGGGYAWIEVEGMREEEVIQATALHLLGVSQP